MKVVKLIGVAGLVCLGTANLFAEDITLVSSDEKPIKISKETAELSATLKNFLEDLGEKASENPIPMPNVDGQVLRAVVDLMQMLTETPNMPLGEQIDHIKGTVKMRDIDYIDLLNAVNYLDIEKLFNPVADAITANLYDTHEDNMFATSRAIYKLNIPAELKVLLAKHWFLNFGKELESGNWQFSQDEKFISLHTKNKAGELIPLDYGFSIQELLDYNKVPKDVFSIAKDSNILELSGLKINDITGLDNFPKIETIRELRLINNKLTDMPSTAFKNFKNLRTIRLSKNKLTKLPANVFAGNPELRDILVSKNNLANLDRNIFNGLINLVYLDLDDNKLTELEPGIFDGLNKLGTISLQGNNILNLQPGIFYGLTSLTDLNLWGNQLSSLDPKVFYEDSDHCLNLININLAKNQLTNLDPETFTCMKRTIKNMSLNLNPLGLEQVKTLREELPGIEISF